MKSLAYRKHEDDILAGNPPPKYTRLLPYIPRGRILELGSAEGVLALLLAKRGDQVTALEKSLERHEDAQRLRDAWGMDVSGPRFVCGDVRDNLRHLEGKDVFLGVRSIYYLRDDLDKVFTEVAKHIPNIVLCGNRNRADRFRNGVEDEPGGPHNFYASKEGMRSLLERHGYEIVNEVTEGDEIVVGRKDV